LIAVRVRSSTQLNFIKYCSLKAGLNEHRTHQNYKNTKLYIARLNRETNKRKHKKKRKTGIWVNVSFLKNFPLQVGYYQDPRIESVRVTVRTPRRGSVRVRNVFSCGRSFCIDWRMVVVGMSYPTAHTQDMFIKSYVKPHSNKQIEII